ncbi:hypothetical protein EH230_12115 [Flavobacterium columnare]|uniref:Uncharacterized protein n=1 Tax=Flavobacterium columnare TaxID=996 RepID=A0A437UD72_9FLAO|nr:hypothetical protein [Flavobacterium columnare]RVU91584.1 hypothetical protein EH230_12115 [Flavobacterium columnare]
MLFFFFLILGSFSYAQNIPDKIVAKEYIANQTPITNLIVSETFTAGDFPVKILELTGNNHTLAKAIL